MGKATFRFKITTPLPRRPSQKLEGGLLTVAPVVSGLHGLLLSLLPQDGGKNKPQPGDGWWPQIVEQAGDKMTYKIIPGTSYVITREKNVMSSKMLEVSLLGVGTVLRLERDAWSMVI